MKPASSDRLARLAVRRVGFGRVSFAVVAVCVGYIILGGRRDNDPAYLLALVVAFALAIVGIQDLMQSRRRQRPIVEGELIHLRLMGRRDAPAFAATIDADVVAENRWAANVREGYIRAVSRSELSSTLAICERSTGAIVGAISLKAAGDCEAELGVWIGPQHRGRGYTSDALAALARMLRKSHYSSIAASTAETNGAMQSALRRAGFAETLRYTHQFPSGETTPAIRFSRSVIIAAKS